MKIIKKLTVLTFLLLLICGQEVWANTNIPGVGVVVKRNPGGGASRAGTTNDKGELSFSIKEAGDYTITLTGTQKNAKGLPVKGATVKCGKPQTNLLVIGTTNEKGEVIWKDAKPGNYTLRVESTGDKCPENYVLKDGVCVPDGDLHQPQTKADFGGATGGGITTQKYELPRGSYGKHDFKFGYGFFLGGGALLPKTNTGIGNFTDLNLSAYIPIKSFSKWSIGLEAGGSYNFSNKDNCPEVATFQVMNQMAQPVVNEKGSGSPKQAGFRLSAGPAAAFAVSNKFILLPSLNAVYSSFKESSCVVTQTSQVNGITYNWDIAKHSTEQSSGVGFMPKLKLVYLFGRIGLWAEGSYMMAQKTKTITSLLVPEGTATNGMYDWGQMNAHSYNTTTTSTAFKAMGLGGGIVVGLGKHRYKFGRDNRVTEYGGATGGVISKNVSEGTSERIINTNATNPIINNPLYNLPPYWFTQCINDKQVALYVVHGLVVDAVYSNLPCNAATWPATGVPGHGGIFTTEPTRHTVVLDKTKWLAAKEQLDFEELSGLPSAAVPTGAALMEISLVASKEQVLLVHKYRFGRDDKLRAASDENLTIVTPLIKEGEMLKTEGYHMVCRTTQKGTTVEKKYADKKRAEYIGHITLLR